MLDTDPFEGIDSITIPRGRLKEIVHKAIRADAERRLERTESAIAGSSQAEREAICQWLGNMLHRPPLERPTPAFRPIAALVEELWWDIATRTPDPLVPDSPSSIIIPSHPWGEGEEA